MVNCDTLENGNLDLINDMSWNNQLLMYLEVF